MEIVLVSIFLVVTIALLITELVPYAVTALGIMAALMISGVLTPEQALAGFANPAPVTVGALFIVSAGVMRTGAIELFGEWISRLSGGQKWRFRLLLLLSVGTLSAFINNTPVVLLFIPAVIQVSCKQDFMPSRYLMLVSYISILGGTCTLVGTSTNIIVSNLAADMGHAPLGMFELAVAGVPIAVAGGVYLYFLAGRLLPAHRTHACTLEHDGARRQYLSEWRVGSECELIGREVGQQLPDSGVDLLEVYRADGDIADPEERRVELSEGDILLVRASAADLVSLAGSRLTPVTARKEIPGGPAGSLREDMLVEIMVPPGSRHVGSPVSKVLGGLDLPVQVLGIKRREQHYRENRLEPIRLEPGDILLAHCASDCQDDLSDGGNLVVIDEVSQVVKNRGRAPLAMAILVAMIAVVASGLVEMVVASLTAAVAMIVTDCVRLRFALRSVDAQVLLLIIGTIALGSAMEKTGAADLYARGVMSLFRDAGPVVLLAGIVTFTSLMSTFVSNNSTAVLMIPLVVKMAASMGVDPRAFIVATAFGASAAFASPVGYQTNLLVYSPGGYRFLDFVKVGLPLNLIVAVGATLLIPIFWPL